MHNDESYRKYLQGEEEEKEMVRKTTKTLFAQDSKETVSLSDFIPRIVLGKGAFGTVLLVEKKNTKELFAMKSINKEDIIKKDQLEHTKTEKMVLSHINHPYLVNLAYAFQTPTKLYFVMQFMSKSTTYFRRRRVVPASFQRQEIP
jgi:serum/glucocorticoid-regulated kinase 2